MEIDTEVNINVILVFPTCPGFASTRNGRHYVWRDQRNGTTVEVQSKAAAQHWEGNCSHWLSWIETLQSQSALLLPGWAQRYFIWHRIKFNHLVSLIRCIRADDRKVILPDLTVNFLSVKFGQKNSYHACIWRIFMNSEKLYSMEWTVNKRKVVLEYAYSKRSRRYVVILQQQLHNKSSVFT